MATSELLTTHQKKAAAGMPEQSIPPRKSRGWVWFLLFVVIAAGAAAYVWQSRSKTAATTDAQPTGRGRGRGAGGGGTPVLVSKVGQKTIPIEAKAIGTVEAFSTVSIRAQIAGQLLEAHFKEGDFVRKGQLLLIIDPRPYQADSGAGKGGVGSRQSGRREQSRPGRPICAASSGRRGRRLSRRNLSRVLQMLQTPP